MGEYKTPGVYIKEKNAFPNSVVEATTAIPVFIGLTEYALNGTESLMSKPMRISSMTEYFKYFGGALIPKFELSIVDKTATDKLFILDRKQEKALTATMKNELCTLYYHMVMFFANGGSTCYIVSIGDYGKVFKDVYSTNKEIIFSNLKKVQDITMLVVPEAVNGDTCMKIYQDMLGHCNEKNRFAILDVPSTEAGAVEKFRNYIGSNFLSHAAVYYPWLETTVVSDNEITGGNFTWDFNLINWEQSSFLDKESAVAEFINKMFKEIKEETKTAKEISQLKNDLHNALMQNWPEYGLLIKKIKDYLNLLPPSAAIAGIYTKVDTTRGVWKAPANVSLNYVNKPSVVINNQIQEELNAPMSGKAVNVIRSFTGEGIKVWGARTLDANSMDWRYINVRRTMSFLEESVKNAARAYIFEPNDASTWINMKCMIENFLRGIWKRGGLAGASPDSAYSVLVGLGETMTPEDILEGIMRITVLVAISHPAEFIEITFQQQMQKS